MSQLNNPHDLLCKKTLGNRKNARSFLQHYLPREILDVIDLDSIEIEKDSFITADLQEYFSDLLYKVRFQEQPGYIYALFEHKSYSEKHIGLQLLEYMLQCWKSKKKKQQHALPIILPIVIYHGREKWTGGNCFADAFAPAPSSLQCYIPDFRYLFYDLQEYGDRDINGIAPLRAMLMLLKHVKDPQFTQMLGKILRLLALEGEIDMEYLSSITIYVLSVTNIPQDRFVEMVIENLSTKGGKIAMSTLEKLVEQGLQKGLQKGRQEGREEGLQKGRREGIIEGLSTALEIKFGTVGSRPLAKIKKMDIKHLSLVKALIKDARSLEEFERELPKI